MPASPEHGSALSVQRAFVVHFGTSRGPGRRRFSGRVEHLASGESAPFSSLEALLAFFDRAGTVAPPGPEQGRETDDRKEN